MPERVRGLPVIDQGKCPDGCRKCVEACPYKKSIFRPATGTSGFGIRSVKGRIRTPRPAARTMALVGLTDIQKFLGLIAQIISR